MTGIDEMKAEIERGYREGNMTARFHLLVLQNPELVRHMGKAEFCKAVGVKESYDTNAQDMLKLAELMEQKGLVIAARNSLKD